MQKTKLIILDEVNCKFEGLDASIIRELVKRNEIFDPANKYIPSVRMGRWSGNKQYFFLNGHSFVNLLPEIIDYLISQNIEIELEDTRTYNREFSFDPIDKNYLANDGIVWPDGHQLAGQPVVLRDHQVDAVNAFLDNKQGIAVLPTSSGKTLDVCVLSKKVEKYGRSIVIVPNKDLITQTEEYYRTFGLDVGVYYGDRKQFFTKHVISTWQSLEKLRQKPIDIGLDEPITFEKFMDGMVAVIVDECHGIAADKLSSLLTKELSKVPIRWALSGTLPKDKHNLINLTIAIGDEFHKIYTTDLQDKGILSKCDVNVLQLIDSKEFSSYANEYDFLVTNKPRLEYISKLIQESGKTGNVLVLVGRKETGRELEKLIAGSIFLSGSNNSKERKSHYDEVKTSDSKIIIATFGIAAVGLDLPRLSSLYLIECGKSYIKVVQSIGRILRTAFDKNYALVWDICSSCRYSKTHLTQRKKWYKEQGFPFTITKINWQQ